MDRSLDEMIKAKKVANKGARAPRRAAASRRSSGVKQQLLGKAPAASPANKARKASGTTPAKPTAAAPVQVADKIIVSNLPLDVSEQQIKELFHQTVGPLRSVQLHFDSAGRSKGIAAVQFVKQGDGPKAFQQYNNRLIDGKRPMKIEIVMSTPVAATQPSLASRVAPAPAAATAKVVKKGRKGVKKGKATKKVAEKRQEKSAADLDAEMEDYTASNAPAVVV